MKLSLVICFFCAVVELPFAQTPPPASGSQSAIDAYHMEQPKLSAFAEDLLNTQKAFLEAMKRGDAAYVSGAIANDFVVITANGDSVGKGELVEYAAPHKDAKAVPMFYDFEVLQLSDNTGLVTYKVVFPQHIERYQHLSDTWVKENGQWKLRFQQTTLNLWSAHDL